MPQIQHYISKCLTRPWEESGHLHFYDFETGRFEKESSRRLLAKPDLWSAELEKVFNKRFERQLNSEIVNFVNGKSVPENEIPYRHIILLHLFNSMRGMKAFYNISTIERFASLTNRELDEEICEFLRTNLIVQIPINPVYRLFFPEKGFFAVPLTMTNSSELNVGFAVPLRTHMAFGIFPIGYDREAFLEIAKSSETFFLELSVGISDRRIIVHPDYINADPALGEKILRARAINQEAAQLVQSSSKALRDRISLAQKNLGLRRQDS